jgi:hypothetical protein
MTTAAKDEAIRTARQLLESAVADGDALFVAKVRGERITGAWINLKLKKEVLILLVDATLEASRLVGMRPRDVLADVATVISESTVVDLKEGGGG